MTNRGNWFRRLIEQLRILSFGIDESDKGSSSKWLLDKFKISKLTRFAIAGGNTKNITKLIFSRFSGNLPWFTNQKSCCGLKSVESQTAGWLKRTKKSKIMIHNKQIGRKYLFLFHIWAEPAATIFFTHRWSESRRTNEDSSPPNQFHAFGIREPLQEFFSLSPYSCLRLVNTELDSYLDKIYFMLRSERKNSQTMTLAFANCYNNCGNDNFKYFCASESSFQWKCWCAVNFI